MSLAENAVYQIPTVNSPIAHLGFFQRSTEKPVSFNHSADKAGLASYIVIGSDEPGLMNIVKVGSDQFERSKFYRSGYNAGYNDGRNALKPRKIAEEQECSFDFNLIKHTPLEYNNEKGAFLGATMFPIASEVEIPMNYEEDKKKHEIFSESFNGNTNYIGDMPKRPRSNETYSLDKSEKNKKMETVTFKGAVNFIGDLPKRRRI